jgi:hypothetical protein
MNHPAADVMTDRWPLIRPMQGNRTVIESEPVPLVLEDGCAIVGHGRLPVSPDPVDIPVDIKVELSVAHIEDYAKLRNQVCDHAADLRGC